jgi:predicted O-methyltransferase YrrM
MEVITIDGVRLGPVMDEEGNILASLVAMMQPQVVVEFGFCQGHSTRYLLHNLSKDGQLVSYDPSPSRFDEDLKAEKRLTLLTRGQETFTPADVSDKKVDLVFFDGSHDFSINVESIKRLLPSMSNDALIVIHDTGLWNTDLFDQPQFGVLVAPKLRAHQPHERKFADWLQTIGFQRINLCPTHITRHGLSILQRTQ